MVVVLVGLSESRGGYELVPKQMFFSVSAVQSACSMCTSANACVHVRQRNHISVLSELEQDRRCFPFRMLGRIEIEGSEQRRDKDVQARGRRGVDELVR